MLSGGDPIPALKRQIAEEICRLVGPYGTDTARRVLGIDEPRASDILHLKLDRFSLQKLIRILAHIDRRVKIEIINEGPLVLRTFNITTPRAYWKRPP